MKLLILSHEYPPIGGGGANACFFLARQFAQSGNTVDILTAMYESLPKVEKTESGVNIYRVKCRRKKKEKSSFMEMLSFLCGAWRMAERMENEKKYDKCLVFFGIPSGPIALHLKKKYGLPYVVRFGGGDIPGLEALAPQVHHDLIGVVKAHGKAHAAGQEVGLGALRQALDISGALCRALGKVR